LQRVAACYSVLQRVISQEGVIHMNESCHTYDWVMPHVWMSHITHMNESCNAYEGVMSRIWMSHVTHINVSCLSYEWVMPHMNESCHKYEWVMSQSERKEAKEASQRRQASAIGVCVVVCCSVLHCVALCCSSVLQCIACVLHCV